MQFPILEGRRVTRLDYLRGHYVEAFGGATLMLADRDPLGHRWTIGHHLEDVSSEEMQRRYDAECG